MPELYAASDIIISDLNLGYLSTSSLEAMSVGRPVIQYVNHHLYSSPPPIITTTLDENSIIQGITKLLDLEYRKKVVDSQSKYVKDNHDVRLIAKRVEQVYTEMLL
jgi:hypothetical protein